MNQRPKCKSYKTLRSKNRKKLHDTGFSNDFLAMTSKPQATKEEIDKLATSKLKTFVCQKTLSRE